MKGLWQDFVKTRQNYSPAAPFTPFKLFSVQVILECAFFFCGLWVLWNPKLTSCCRNDDLWTPFFHRFLTQCWVFTTEHVVRRTRRNCTTLAVQIVLVHTFETQTLRRSFWGVSRSPARPSRLHAVCWFSLTPSLLCGVDSTGSLVSSQVSAQLCLSQVEALLACCHGNSPTSCLPPGSDNKLRWVGPRWHHNTMFGSQQLVLVFLLQSGVFWSSAEDSGADEPTETAGEGHGDELLQAAAGRRPRTSPFGSRRFCLWPGLLFYGSRTRGSWPRCLWLWRPTTGSACRPGLPSCLRPRPSQTSRRWCELLAGCSRKY